jgi:PAS domain S-box-containing protein
MQDNEYLIHELRTHQIELELQNEELLRMQAQLEELNHKHSDLYNLSPIGYFTFDSQGLIKDVNLRGAEQLGKVKSWLINKPFIFFIAQEDRDSFFLHQRNVRQTKTRQICEIKIINKLRGSFYAQLVSIAVQDENGEYSLCRTAVIDITEQRQIKEELAKTQALLLAAIEQTPAGIIIADAPDVRIRIANSAALEIRGKSSYKLTDIPMHMHHENWQTFHLDGTPYKPEDLPLSKAILHGKTSKNVDVVIHRASGEERIVMANAAPVRNEEGEIIAGVVVFTDITERKEMEEEIKKHRDHLKDLVQQRTTHLVSVNQKLQQEIDERKRIEESLRQSEERFRLIAETSHDVFWMSTPGIKKMLYVSPAYERIWGRSVESLYESPRSFIEAIHPDDQERVRAGIKDHEQGAWNFEYRIIQLDGSIRWIKDRGFPICDINGALHLMTGIATDITEQKKIEEEARIRMDQLIQADKMASLGTMVSGVAHEINNPNNYILSNAQLIDSFCHDALHIMERYYHEKNEFSIGGLPFSEVHELIPQLVAGIIDGSRRIKVIIDNLKNFTQKDSSASDEVFSINSLIRTSIAIITNQIKKYTDNFNLALQENLPSVKGKAQKIEQVIINLLLNALHALPDRSSGVWVSTSFDRSSGHVIIKVRDNGIGMSKDVLKRIIEPFFTTKLDRGGTGLGLSISYAIIQEHQGLLEFESEPQKGTTVTVKLPMGDRKK